MDTKSYDSFESVLYLYCVIDLYSEDNLQPVVAYHWTSLKTKALAMYDGTWHVSICINTRKPKV